MRRAWLHYLLLLTLCASLATLLEGWFRGWSGNRARSGNVLEVALGDGRRVFARHFFAKADAYFHNGYYPTIFDSREGFDEGHITAKAGLSAAVAGEAADFLGKPRDWIEAFGRNFFPSVHTHLGEEPCDHTGPCAHGDHGDHEDHGDHTAVGESDPEHEHGDDHVHGPECDHGSDHASDTGADRAPSGVEREILPWLRLSASLDPERVETYVVGAYWLRGALGKPEEAERFLREGLRANPGNPEILFELGRIYAESHALPERALTLYELGYRNLLSRESAMPGETNLFLRAQLLGNLGKMEEDLGRLPAAIAYYRKLMEISPRREVLGQYVAGLEEKLAVPK